MTHSSRTISIATVAPRPNHYSLGWNKWLATSWFMSNWGADSRVITFWVSPSDCLLNKLTDIG